MASSSSGIQMQVHTKFIDWKKKIKIDRMKIGKEGLGELSDKRLTLTLVRYFEARPVAYNELVNVNINLKEN